MTAITVVQDDYGYQLNFTLEDSTGAAFSLTGNIGLLFRAQLQNKASVSFSGAMTVVSASAGTCYYLVGQGNFSFAQPYVGEIQVSFSGQVVTFSNIQITVLPKVPF